MYPVAQLAMEDADAGTSSFVVSTSYGETAHMSLLGSDVPVRLSNVCPFLPRHAELSYDTAGGSLAHFLVHPDECEVELKKAGVLEYDYERLFEEQRLALAEANRISNLKRNEDATRRGRQEEEEAAAAASSSSSKRGAAPTRRGDGRAGPDGDRGGRPYDLMNEFCTSIGGKDIPTPNHEHPGTKMVLVGDMAQMRQFVAKCSGSLQRNLRVAFAELSGEDAMLDDAQDPVGKGGPEETRGRGKAAASKKTPRRPRRTRDAVLFCVADVLAVARDERVLDYTKMSRNAVLFMTSVRDVVRDEFLSQLNSALYYIVAIEKQPTVPGGPYYGILPRSLEECREWQKFPDVTKKNWNNFQRFLGHARGRLLNGLRFHLNMVCSVCDADVTDDCTALDTGRKVTHCGVPVRNLSKFVRTQNKGVKSAYSLNCCRSVKIVKDESPTVTTYDATSKTATARKATSEEKKEIFERPCHLGDRFALRHVQDTENHRDTYPKLAETIYLLVPFSRRATLKELARERAKAGLGETVDDDLLRVHHTVECRVPMYSEEGKLVEYSFEAVALRGKITFSVQATMGKVQLFNPEATTKRFSVKMYDADGAPVTQVFRQQLQYSGNENVLLTAELLNLTNFKQHAPGYRQRDPGHDNFTRYGETYTGAMAANVVLCANYDGAPLVSPESLGFRRVEVTLMQGKKKRTKRLATIESAARCLDARPAAATTTAAAAADRDASPGVLSGGLCSASPCRCIGEASTEQREEAWKEERRKLQLRADEAVQYAERVRQAFTEELEGATYTILEQSFEVQSSLEAKNTIEKELRASEAERQKALEAMQRLEKECEEMRRTSVAEIVRLKCRLSSYETPGVPPWKRARRH